MINLNNNLDTLVILTTYMFIYNLSLFIIFWTLYNFISFNFKTLYSFNDLKFNFFFVSIISITFFSLAGVPPFTGFFSKILILLLLINSNFTLLYYFFFTLLFFGLYFYLQNMRFLHTTSNGVLNYSFVNNIRVPYAYYVYSIFVGFFLIFGIFFLDDMLLYFYWLFS